LAAVFQPGLPAIAAAASQLQARLAAGFRLSLAS